MKINIISIFFPPEGGAAASRIMNMAQSLQSLGYDVEVITALPNYPTGQIFEAYRGRFMVRETVQGVPCRRYWLDPSNSKSPIRRIWGMVSFSVSIIAALPYLWQRKPNLLIINSPPLVTGFLAVFLSKITSAKSVLNISDIWPLSALELGAIKRGRFYSLLEWVERTMYKNADAILTQSQETLEHIAAITPKKPLLVYRNLDLPSPFLNESAVFDKKTFKIVYAGLLGVAQGVFNICKTIDFKRLNIALDIYGAGNERDAIAQFIAENPDCNITLKEMIPKREVPKMLANYHATLIPLVNHIEGAFPSKIFMAVSAGLPVFFSGSGEGAKVVENLQLGWVNAPDDMQTLKENLTKFTTLSTNEYKTIRQNCINAVENEFNFEKQKQLLHTFLENQ